MSDLGATEADSIATTHRLSYSTDLAAAVAEADLMIEAVPGGKERGLCGDGRGQDMKLSTQSQCSLLRWSLAVDDERPTG